MPPASRRQSFLVATTLFFRGSLKQAGRLLRWAPLASNPYPKALYVSTSVCVPQMMRELLSCPAFILAIRYSSEHQTGTQAVFFLAITFSSRPVPHPRLRLPTHFYTTALPCRPPLSGRCFAFAFRRDTMQRSHAFNRSGPGCAANFSSSGADMLARFLQATSPTSSEESWTSVITKS